MANDHPLRELWRKHIDPNCGTCKGKGYITNRDGGEECPTCTPMTGANNEADEGQYDGI
jgi:hypothetical protein